MRGTQERKAVCSVVFSDIQFVKDSAINASAHKLLSFLIWLWLWDKLLKWKLWAFLRILIHISKLFSTKVITILFYNIYKKELDIIIFYKLVDLISKKCYLHFFDFWWSWTWLKELHDNPIVRYYLSTLNYGLKVF